MTETWNPGIPLITNQVAADILDIEENFDYLMAMGGYWVDYSEADQGAAGSGNSVKDLVDAIGTTKSATLFFKHNAADGSTTTYSFGTSETIPSNINIIIQNGAILALATGITLTMNTPQAGLYQIFSLTGTGIPAFGAGGRVYPEWFGENTIPGTTDMTAEIQAAIDSITAGEVCFNGETYLISSPLVPESYVNLVGTGGSIIKLAASADDDMVDFTGTDTDVLIENLIWDGNGSNNTRGGGVNIINATTQVKRLTITKCKFLNSCYNSIRLNDSLAHEDIIITDNKFYDYDATAVQIYNTDGGVISNNIFDNTGLAAMTAGGNGIQIIDATDFTIANNTIDMDSSALAAAFGIETGSGSDNCTITGNTIQCNSGAFNGGISVAMGGGTGSDNTTISGNSVYQAGKVAAIEVSGALNGASVTGNTIDGTANGITSIAVTNDNAYVSVTGNVI